MDKRVFNAFCKIVYDKSGISLNEGKESLVAARIGKRMRVLGLDDPKEYLKRVQNDASDEEIVQLLDNISTNVTSFFREPAHFDLMRSLLRQWQAAGQRRFRFWSAACSSGEEPYTMAMVIAEELGLSADARVLATDISTRILGKCLEGAYAQKLVTPVKKELLDRYFSQEADLGGGPRYRVVPTLKRMVLFKRLNLSAPPFPMKGPLDIVFCRNVMIYFDNIIRTRLVNEIYRLLKPGGYLFIGHAESLTGLDTKFVGVQPAVYIKQ